MSIKVTDNVVERFSKIYRQSINDYIERSVSKSLQVQLADSFLSFKFNKNEVHIYKVYQFEVVELVQLAYKQMITDSFLNHFIDIKDELPVRLSRWAEHGYIDYIYKEIVQSLNFHRIQGLFNYNKELEWEWKSVGVRMIMNHDFVFYKLELI